MRRILALGAILALVGTASATPITVWYNDCSSLDGISTYAPLGPPYLANGGVMADIGPDDTGYFTSFIEMNPGAGANEGYSIHNEGMGWLTISLRWDADPNDPNWCPDPNAGEYVTFWLRLYSSVQDPNDPNVWNFSGAQNYAFEIPACQGWQAFNRDVNDWNETDFWGPFDPNHVYGWHLDYVVWNSDYHPCSIGFDELGVYTPECPRDLTGDDDVDLSDLAALLGEYGCSETEATLYTTAGFEGYSDGNLVGQDLWETLGFTGEATVMDDPTGGGMGKVVKLDAQNDTGDLVNVYRPITPWVTEGVIVYEWDQYRDDLGDNVWICDEYDYGNWWSLEYDSDGTIGPACNWGGCVPLTAGQWEHIRFDLNLTESRAAVDVDGVTMDQPFTFDDIRGIEFEINDTDTVGDGPIYLDNVVIKYYDICPIDWFDDGQTGLNDLAELLGDYGCGVP